MMMKKIKTVSIAILGVLCLVIVLQNRESVETRLLFFSIKMPRAALLFVTAAVGFALGVLTSYYMAKQQPASSQKDESREPSKPSE